VNVFKYGVCMVIRLATEPTEQEPGDTITVMVEKVTPRHVLTAGE